MESGEDNPPGEAGAYFRAVFPAGFLPFDCHGRSGPRTCHSKGNRGAPWGHDPGGECEGECGVHSGSPCGSAAGFALR